MHEMHGVRAHETFDIMTLFLTQRCPAADQAHRERRIHQLKSEVGDDQQPQASRMDVQGEGSLQEGAQHEGCVQGLQGTERCLSQFP